MKCVKVLMSVLVLIMLFTACSPGEQNVTNLEGKHDSSSLEKSDTGASETESTSSISIQEFDTVTSEMELTTQASIQIGPLDLIINYSEEWKTFLSLGTVSKADFDKTLQENHYPLGIAYWEMYQDFKRIIDTSFLPCSEELSISEMQVRPNDGYIYWGCKLGEKAVCWIVEYPTSEDHYKQAQERADSYRASLERINHPQLKEFYYCQRLYDWKAEYGDLPVREIYLGFMKNRFIIIIIVFLDKEECDRLVSKLLFEPITERKNPFRQK